MNVDKSIFIDVKEDIEKLLGNYESHSLVKENEKLISTLYVCNEECINKLKEFEKRLLNEYGYDDRILRKYNLSNIVKIINREQSAYHFKLYRKDGWTQVNDRDKVKARLDTKFVIWRNSYKHFTMKKLQKEDKNVKDIVLADIHKEIKKAEVELEYIKNNFEKLDVRISSYDTRTPFTAVTYYFYNNKNRQKIGRVLLKKFIPNILWYEFLPEEERESELKKFFRVAKHAFGHIYYKEREE